MTTPLAGLLRARVADSGPVTLAEFMAEALGHPRHGYYMTRDPLGAAGDFTTAPEVSQMFGELIGLWCAQVWRGMGEPDPVQLVELGPGRGTLMSDMLRAAAMASGFGEAARVSLVETSPVLRARQREALAGHDIAWWDSVDEAPVGPALFVANEFFDALPVHQFERTRHGWRERMVGLAGDGETFRLVPAAHETTAVESIPPSVRKTARVGEISETRPAAAAIAGAIGERLARFGGAALIVDYGHAASAAGDTLQAVRGHARHDPLADPGEADLTAHVDFEVLAQAAVAAGAVAHGPLGQGVFLTSLGIEVRAGRLKHGATGAQARDIDAARHRLIAGEEMGALFKVLALTGPGQPAPPGFETSPEIALAT